MSNLGQKFHYENPKLLKHARGKPCQNCGREDATIVACHSNNGSDHGKGRGIKAHDIFSAFLCGDCHYWLDFDVISLDPTGLWDATQEGKRMMWQKAHDKTLLIWLSDGVLK